ncbi:amidohydrolase, partial [Pseudomonas sp. MWU13-2625]
TIGAAQAGSVSNVIPDSARLEATVRAFNPAIQQLIERRLREMVAAQAQSFGVTAQVEWRHVTRVLVNSPEETRIAREVAEAMAGPQGIVPLPAGAMGGDDFSWMLEQVPGCYVVLGNGIGSKGGCMIHNPGYDFNDEILSVGASYWARLAEAFLRG